MGLRLPLARPIRGVVIVGYYIIIIIFLSNRKTRSIFTANLATDCNDSKAVSDMNDNNHGVPTGDKTVSDEEQLFNDAPSADDILNGDSGDTEVSEAADGKEPDKRQEPLFDEDLKAPWEGAEDKWQEHRKNGGAGAALDNYSISDQSDIESVDGGKGNERISVDPGVPAIPTKPPPAEMTGGHKFTIVALVLSFFCGLGALAWAFDLNEQVAHQNRNLTVLGERLDVRMRQISALRDSGEARVLEMEQRIAGLSGAGDQTTKIWVDQMQKNLDQARLDVALASEKMAGEELGERIRKADSHRKRRKDNLAKEVAEVESTAASVEQDTESLDSLLAGAIGEKALLPAQKVEPVVSVENALPGDTASSLPERPGRDQVKSAMGLVAARVRACAKGDSGRLLVQVKVLGTTGRITSAAVIDDKFKGTSVASCAARAVRQAKFPRFAKEQIFIKYPFDL